MAWTPSHQNLGRHPKLLLVAGMLHLPRVTVVGHLHYLWWWCLDYAQDGSLARYTVEQIAQAGEWDGDPNVFVSALADARFLDRVGETFVVHDWDDYGGRYLAQQRASRERMRRFRNARRAEGSGSSSDRYAQRNGQLQATDAQQAVTSHAREEETREEKKENHSPVGPLREGTPRRTNSSWAGPEWWKPLASLVGYRAEDHSKAVKVVEASCNEAGVNPLYVVQHFADYYRTARIKNAWTDPVKALLKTLPLEIAKELKAQGKPHAAPAPGSMEDVLKLSDFEIQKMGDQGVWEALVEVYERDGVVAAAAKVKEWRAGPGKPR